MNPAALAKLANGDEANTIIANTPGGIERQMREGQIDLVSKADRLPIALTFPHDLGINEMARRLGIELGENVDDIFIAAKLPAGWQLKATSHSMWSELVDANGSKRGTIYYNAAFYDRRASMSVNGRYNIKSDYASPTSTVSVLDGATGESLYVAGTHQRVDHEAQAKVDSRAREWLDTNYPDHADPFAYWNPAA